MSWRKYWGEATIGVCVMAMLSACGGGGGGSPGGGITTPAPPVAPVPSAPSAPAFAGPSVGHSYTSSTGAAATSTPAAASSQFTITITDPDAPTATNLGQINFSGNENITLQFTSSVGTATQTWRPATKSSADLYGFAPAPLAFSGGFPSYARNVSSIYWVTGSGTPQVNTFQLFKLQEGDTPAAGSRDTGDLTDHVALVRVSNLDGVTVGGFGIIGDVTASSEMPLTGAAVFKGELYGTFSHPDPARGNGTFVNPIQLSVNFATGSITGYADSPAHNNAFADAPDTLSFSGAISGNAFSSSNVAITTQNGSMNGAAQGAFYGQGSAAATEAGGVFSASGGGVTVVGGFVAGKQ